MTLQTNRPILTSIAALILCCLFAGASLAGQPCPGAAQAGNAQMAHGRALGESMLAAFASQADVRLEAVLQNLRTLALTGEVRSGKWENMQQLIAAFQAQNPQLLIFYINPDGSYYTAEMGLTGKNLSDRAYFPGLMAGNEVLGDIVVGKTSGKRSFIVGAPIVEQGQVTGAMGAAVYADNLTAAMENSMPIPQSMVILATDKNNTLALCTGLDEGVTRPCQTAGVAPCLAAEKPGRSLSITSSLTGWKFSIVGAGCKK
ncbi:MAG: hypothetical protein JEZ02_11555 [Desulfatibacillum sp.]|nr:hypothetical protein [Desulfatibacillum sp.]